MIGLPALASFLDCLLTLGLLDPSLILRNAGDSDVAEVVDVFWDVGPKLPTLFLASDVRFYVLGGDIGEQFGFGGGEGGVHHS